MKSWKFVAGAALVLGGFCAGADLNIFKLNSTVYGATADPNSALKSVAHDGTLAGDGTTSAPLGIANGGVSAPKLSAAVPPSMGQLLGFNGANLSWQNPPVGGVRVVDSLGQVVGPLVLVSPDAVLHQAAGLTFAITVTSEGFGNTGTYEFYHATADCSGPRYLNNSGSSLVRSYSFNDGPELFYPAGPPQTLTINSREFADEQHPDEPGVCQAFGAAAQAVGQVATFNLNTLGLTPPFHLEF